MSYILGIVFGLFFVYVSQRMDGRSPFRELYDKVFGLDDDGEPPYNTVLAFVFAPFYVPGILIGVAYHLGYIPAE